jgi:hypothetical protein
MQITNQPRAWTFAGWLHEEINSHIHVYVFYAGDLHDAQNAATPFDLNLLFTARDGFRIRSLAQHTFPAPGVLTHTLNGFRVSANASAIVNFSLSDGTEMPVQGTVHFLPLNFRQENMPNLGITPANSTDLGGPRGRWMLDNNDIAYITGEPTTPQLRAQFRGAPNTIQIEWRLTIRTERPERRLLDNRNIPGPANQFVAVAGNAHWDIQAAINEFVGGDCVLYFRIGGNHIGNVSFRIRGKNPLDANAETFINANVGNEFQNIRTAIPRHESRQGRRVYNQFNSQNAISGTLNFGGPNGWGMAQIDRSRQEGGVTTAEVWNWNENIRAYNRKLLEKLAVYNRFIGYFRTAYGTRANWSEPPGNHRYIQTTLPAQDWGVLVLYNGTQGVPKTRIPGRTNRVRSPWVFNPTTGVWTFHDNRRVINGVVRQYAREIEPEFRNPLPPNLVPQE